MTTPDQHTLGETDAELTPATREENRLITLGMIRQARRSLNIISREFDPTIYDDFELVEAVKQMLLDNRRARVRVIVFEPRQVVQRGHKFLQLSQGLSSFIEIQRGGRQHDAFAEAIFLADDCGYIHRKLWSRYEANANFNDRRQCQAFMNRFEEMWAAAIPDSNLRRLRI